MTEHEELPPDLPIPTPEAPEEKKAIQDKLEEELEEYKDKYLRLLADTENMRKRMMKEKQEHLRFATGELVAKLLDPIDNFEKALGFASANVSAEVKNWSMGFQMILQQFKEFLEQNGITSFKSVGNPFDPSKHQALEIEETNDYPPGIVIEEFVKGYASGDHIIRAARVKVSAAKKQAEQTQNS